MLAKLGRVDPSLLYPIAHQSEQINALDRSIEKLGNANLRKLLVGACLLRRATCGDVGLFRPIPPRNGD
ncbi:MAG: hypothetical protein ACI9R3_001445 [Verrucomicrobiales bacterium]|jgi:hypothetical protein